MTKTNETETLTEGERDRLTSAVDWAPGEHAGRKALRIIDRDAAALARVRAALDPQNGWRDLPARIAGVYEALAGSPAAPEATTNPKATAALGARRPEAGAAGCGGAGADLAAANARIAELERKHNLAVAANGHKAELLNAANARAEAAERDKLSAEAQSNDWMRSLQRAESEAAALRAEVARLNKACDDYAAAYLKDMGRSRDEGAALRAEVAELRAFATKVYNGESEAISSLAAANAQLAEARALLKTANSPTVEWSERYHAHLTANPVSPRAAAERAVLDAMADVDSHVLYMWATHVSPSVSAIGRAELARRAVAP